MPETKSETAARKKDEKASRRDWQARIGSAALFAVTIFTALGVNGQVQAMKDEVTLLRVEVQKLAQVRDEIRDLSQARNDIIRAIRRATRDGDR